MPTWWKWLAALLVVGVAAALHGPRHALTTPVNPGRRNLLSQTIHASVCWVIFSSAGPLSLASLVFALVTKKQQRTTPWLLAYALAEAAWWLAVRWAIATRLDARPGPLRGLKRSTSRRAIDKLHAEELADPARGRALISGWFFNGDYRSIKRRDLLDWWAWVASNAPSIDAAHDRAELEKDVDALRQRLQHDETGERRSSEDESSSPRCIRLNQDSVRERALAKPLWLYALLRGGSALASAAIMRSLGFRRRRFGALPFWVWTPSPSLGRPEEEEAKEEGEPPLVFVHGLGLGLLPYASLLRKFVDEARRTKRRAVVVPDLFYVALAPPLEIHARGGVPDAAAHVRAIEEALAGATADFFVHSYGSVVASWLVQRKPHLIRALAMAEPVSVLIHHARVARTFLYETGAKPNLVKAVVARAVATDPGVVHVLMRHFWWFENTLFLQDLHGLNHAPLLLLSEHDEYTPSDLIRRRLQAYRCDDKEPSPTVVWFEGATHGDVALSSSIRHRYFAEFLSLVQRCRRAAPGKGRRSSPGVSTS